ncbi:MAG: hypothetical protein M5R36_13935 [Deltaproteobacteria bacterium]|nr:hypothetical protein [Deltaproteobacteria bacterium]
MGNTQTNKAPGLPETRPAVKGLTPDALRDEMRRLGQKPFRADQIYRWVFSATRRRSRT